MSNSYSKSFYYKRNQKTVHAAEVILSKALKIIPEVKSAVDMGCGVGTWLSILKGKGVERIMGLDGPWVNKGFLEIDQDSFTETDLTQPVKFDLKFDLAISMEVAEHLPPESAQTFVKSITDLSDFILFSAAIPFQGGRKHLNEQWQDYWVDLFRKEDFVAADMIRNEIWNDDKIPVWYRQNTLLFVNKNRTDDIKAQIPNQVIFSAVHPKLFMDQVKRNPMNWKDIVIGKKSMRLP